MKHEGRCFICGKILASGYENLLIKNTDKYMHLNIVKENIENSAKMFELLADYFHPDNDRKQIDYSGLFKIFITSFLHSEK